MTKWLTSISRFVAVSISVVVVLALTSTSAQAHFLGQYVWSVDTYEIRYEDYTQWNDALSHAVNSWNALGTPGVNIAYDAWNTATDLEVRDYTNSGDGRCGYWTRRTGADLIALNGYYFSRYGTSDRRACMTHEWGHAHGLAHSYTDQVMDSCPTSWCNSPAPTTPQSHDRSDYDVLW